jgi:DNA repair exonuclease SbcCD ATPase subunit
MIQRVRAFPIDIGITVLMNPTQPEKRSLSTENGSKNAMKKPKVELRMPPSRQSTSMAALLDRIQSPAPRALSTLSDTSRLNARKSLTNVIEDQSADLKRLRAELLTVKTSKSDLEDKTDEQIRAQKKTIEYNEQRVKKLLAGRAGLIKSNNDLEKANKVLETDNNDLKKANEILEASKNEVKKEAEDLLANSQNMIEKTSKLEKSHGSLVKANEIWRRNSEQLQLFKTKSIATLQKLDVLVQKQEKELREKSAEIIALKAKLDAGVKLSEASTQREHERVCLVETNSKLQMTVTHLQDILTEQGTLLRALEKSVAEKVTCLKEHEDRIAQLEAEMRELREWLEVMPTCIRSSK